mmetsp:Transcript_125801/g.355722  ORF Transcript_125801/g.355722 Transcript_125801/m.355722 type:complete len:161 (+) Transcript_125801:289-771(+)
MRSGTMSDSNWESASTQALGELLGVFAWPNVVLNPWGGDRIIVVVVGCSSTQSWSPKLQLAHEGHCSCTSMWAHEHAPGVCLKRWFAAYRIRAPQVARLPPCTHTASHGDGPEALGRNDDACDSEEPRAVSESSLGARTGGRGGPLLSSSARPGQKKVIL